MTRTLRCGQRPMSMPRRSRINLADVAQHIIQRGNNRQATFFAEEHYRFYLNRLFEASRKYGCAVYVYVLMTNHVHLLASASKPYDLHGLVLDGVYHIGADGAPVFHPAPAPTGE